MVNYVTKSIFLFSLLFIGPVTESFGLIADGDVKPCCPENVVLVPKGRFCIDKYEWPNKKGEYPDFAMSAYEAENDCKSVGKRLCTHLEWYTACMGKNNMFYGYGPFWKRGVCNDSIGTGYVPVDWTKMHQGHAVWKAYAATLFKGVRSGSLEGCYSDEGDDKVYDMIGNVREWVKDPYGNGGYAFESSFWYGTLSGPASCGFQVSVHAPTFASYENGTRCCKDTE